MQEAIEVIATITCHGAFRAQKRLELQFIVERVHAAPAGDKVLEGINL
jgi:hypothetical protein